MGRIVAHFIHAIGAAGADRGDLGPIAQGEYLHRAVAIAGPDLRMADNQHAIGTGRVVVAGGAREHPGSDLVYERVGMGIDDVDGFVRAVAKDVNSDRGIDEADVEAVERRTRHRDRGQRGQDFIGGRRREHHRGH